MKHLPPEFVMAARLVLASRPPSGANCWCFLLREDESSVERKDKKASISRG
jgi:hypothetical protein